MKKNDYDVIVIGGGITGAGTARDCALRGLSVLLVERFDFGHGATGRNHGLLHSGARYAVTDPDSAAECISENETLRRIARHCVEDTDGLFITLPGDDLGYQATFVEACHRSGIRADIIDPAEARALEPAVNPAITGAVRVPDAYIDPFRLTNANVLDAQRHGAKILIFHEVTDFIMSGTAVTGVRLRDNRTGAVTEAHAPVTINAAGIWGQAIARMAGVTLNMFPAKGAMLIYGHRINNMVINRCRKPSNADILVPTETVCVVGTTSDRVGIETIDDMHVSAHEVEVLMQGALQLAPSLAATRVLRAYAGVRPLVADDRDPSGRSISRGIVCLDHAVRDGLDGLVTITGGKMMTYRLMAERVTNLACQKLGNDKPCTTTAVPLPGSEKTDDGNRLVSASQRAAEDRHGSLTREIKGNTRADKVIICECEKVSVGEVKFAIDELRVRNLLNLRQSARVGMGICQGKLCACRAAAQLCKRHGDVARAVNDLGDFINERWKGMRPVAWGQTMSEGQIMATVYQGLCGIDRETDKTTKS